MQMKDNHVISFYYKEQLPHFKKMKFKLYYPKTVIINFHAAENWQDGKLNNALSMKFPTTLKANQSINNFIYRSAKKI